MLALELIVAAIALIIFLILSYRVGKILNSNAILVTLLLTIFWSLAGAIPLLIGKLLTGASEPIFIIEKELFLINPDSSYLTTLISYIIFIGTIIAILTFFGKHYSSRFPLVSIRGWVTFANEFSHLTLLSANLIIALFVYTQVSTNELLAGTLPVYQTGYRIPNRLISYCQSGALISTALGSILFNISTKGSQLMRRFMAAGYVLIYTLACYPFWVNGTRNTIFLTMVGLIVGIVTLAGITPQNVFSSLPKLKLVIILVLISFVFISVTTTTRGFSLSSNPSGGTQTSNPSGDKNLDEQNLLKPIEEVFQNLSSKSDSLIGALFSKSSYSDWTGRGEIIDSHASLYGVITQMSAKPSVKLEPTYGRYAKIVGASDSKGYTINPVAALWMNIGILAPFVAGIYMSLLILFFWISSRFVPRNFLPIIALPSLALSAASIPVLLSRSGPEGIWGLFVNVTFLPGIFLILPTLVPHLKSKYLGSRS